MAIRNIKIMRFKDSGKYYDEMYVQVTSDEYYAAIDEIRELRSRADTSLIWMVTGEGMPFEVPALIVI
jgi:hypothetical protein